MKKWLLALLAVAVCGGVFFVLWDLFTPPEDLGGDEPPHACVFGEWQNVIPATCEGQGKDVRTCTCGEQEERALDPLDHDRISHGAKAPTCTEVGWNAYETCSRCDFTTYNEIPALRHDTVEHAGKSPTCIEGGWDAYVTCTRCDYSTYVEIAATGHSYNAVVTDPTCTAQGFTTHTCANCGDSYVTDYVDAAEHHYEAVVTPPTTSAQGYTTYTCTGCGDTYVGDYTDPLPYEPGDSDGDGKVNTDDAIYLLYNVMFGDEDYPVNQNCDFDGNGTVNTDDAIYLLYHVMFGEEDYPLA